MSTIAQQLIARMIIFCMVAGIAHAGTDVRDSLAKWSQGKRIQVVLNSGERITGRLGPVQPDAFSLRAEKGARTERILKFDEVRSVTSKLTTAQKWGIAGGIYAGLCVMGLVLGK